MERPFARKRLVQQSEEFGLVHYLINLRELYLPCRRRDLPLLESCLSPLALCPLPLRVRGLRIESFRSPTDLCMRVVHETRYPEQSRKARRTVRRFGLWHLESVQMLSQQAHLLDRPTLPTFG